MQTYIVLKNYNIENIFFLSPQTNKVIQKSTYIKFIYSNELVSLNGVYFYINLPIKEINNKYNKYIISFDLKNFELYDEIIKCEETILNKYSTDKLKVVNLKKQIESEKLSFYSNSSINSSLQIIPLLFKISGIWETQKEIGLSYKIININHQLSQNKY